MTELQQKTLADIAKKQQNSAADPNISAWVEASAGTGKTKVLSDRVLRLLLNSPTPHPERILCLTYTKAGAVEMKSRIYERLSQWAVISDEALQQSLIDLFAPEIPSFEELQQYKKRARILFAVLLDAPGGMKIQTIHSFCQDLLSRFPLEAGVPPYFEVIEDEEQNDILKQIRRQLIIEAQTFPKSQPAEYMRYITENLKESGFAKCLEDIIDNRVKLQNIFYRYNNFSEFEKELAEKLHVDKNLTTADIYQNFMASLKGKLDVFIDTFYHGTDTEIKEAETLQQIVNNGYQAKDFETLKKIFLTDKNTPKQKGKKNSKAYNPQIEEQALKIADEIYNSMQKVARQKLFFSSQAVFGLAHELFAKYAEYKKERTKLDFNDLIFITDKLLSNSANANWVLYKLDGGIDHILVDEAQDTSPEQWNIVKALSEEFFAGAGSKKEKCTLFVVGDRKQSIFSFQGADPAKMEDMAEYFAKKAGDDFAKINLDVSFRSTAAVLDIVNKVFASPNVSAGVAPKNEKVHHLPYRIGEFGKVEIWPLLIKDKNVSADDDEKTYLKPQKQPSLKYQLAQKIVAKIKELMQKSKNTPRPLHFGDFMVLVQKRAHFINEFIRACKEGDVNVSGADRIKLSEQIAVQDLVSLAKFLLLPNDDLSLAEVLKSPLFNLDDDDLFKLCYNRGKANLWSKLGDIKEYQQTYQQLQHLCNLVDYVRPYELFNYVLTKLDGRKKFILRMGYEVEDALDEFINQVINFEKNHIPSLQNFVEWITEHNLEIKREAKQNDVDAVRLMTVHGSKGLQARVVFLPDTNVANNVINKQKVLIDETSDLAYFPLNKDYYEENTLKLNISLAQKEEQERKRLLYVALTRAEDELYICGYAGSDKKEKGNSWYEYCNNTLKEQGISIDNGGYAYEVAGEILPDKKSDMLITENTTSSAETWIYTDIKPENPLSKPYTPSKMEDEDDVDSVSPLSDDGNYYKRGTVIHKLLQFLPQTQEDKTEVAKKYLAQSDFSLSEQQQILNEVSAVLRTSEFADIFGENSRAEVPIMGEIDGKIISAQIDRLVIMPNKIMIVDFKTNRRVDEIPPVYINQLNMYAKLINKIYPALPIETYILWTNKLKLTRIENNT